MAVAPDESRLALIRSDAIELVALRGAESNVRIPPHGVKPSEEMGEGTYMGWRSPPTAGVCMSAARTA